jgi:HAD superfamily hydrolase (TIGR01509 family)
VIRGVVFDLDGVIADTEPLHWLASRDVLHECGVDIDLDEYRRHWIARGGGWERACEVYALPLDVDALRARKGALYRALLAERVAARPGAAEALARLRRTHRVGLATNTVRDEATFILDRLGVTRLFDAIIAREDYARAKPAPDAYLAAAVTLGLAPAECVVVEDTERGVQAGLAAGMRVVAVPNELTLDNDFTGAARRLRTLDEVTAELLAGL